MRQVTQLLLAWHEGDQTALNQLVPLVHDELRRIARRCMAHEHVGHTLQPTALVNEAYMRLIDVQHIQWQNRAHFLAIAARLMRQILVDFARSKRYQKRGGSAIRVTFSEELAAIDDRGGDLVAIHEALAALETVDQRKGRVVELRFFGGLSVKETSEALGISAETVMRDWKFAKAWLSREIAESRPAR